MAVPRIHGRRAELTESNPFLPLTQVRMMDKLALEKEKFDGLLDKLHLDVKHAKVHSEYDQYETITEEVGG